MATKRVDVRVVGTYFESLSDPRHTRNRKHLLVDIMVIAICAIISNAEGPTAIHRWAKAHATWLGTILRLPNGIPSRDCIRRLLIALKPEAFQKCFEAWVKDSVEIDTGGGKRLIAIDGKCCRGSHDRSRELGPLHLVSAWASEQGIALGQVATEEKSNEITAIPQLLAQIDLKNSIVTIDAIGCQKTIVQQIDKAGGGYVIAVKGNQPKLHDAVRDVIREQLDEAWRSASKTGPPREADRHRNGTHRKRLLMLASHNETPASRRQGCLRWKITDAFGGRIGTA